MGALLQQNHNHGPLRNVLRARAMARSPHRRPGGGGPMVQAVRKRGQAISQLFIGCWKIFR